MPVSLPIQLLAHGEGLPIPEYATEGSSGFDLRAAIEGPIILLPGSRFLVPCGFCIKIPLGFEGQIRSRSGLALSHGIGVLNSPGTIDSDYTGEIKVILINLGSGEFELSRGMRCAQMIIAPIERVQLTRVDDLSSSIRHDHLTRRKDGFGSTGLT